MKNSLFKSIFLLSLILWLVHQDFYAQKKIKFGEPSLTDLSMTVYDKDTSAVAVVLYENCDVRYEYIGENFRLITNYTIRIKILKDAGLGRGDFKIPYYDAVKTTDDEVISGITGFTHNMVNGKPEKTKLNKEYIFDEQTTDLWKQKKIAFPNVKVGSIVELKYEHMSPFYWTVNDFYFQSSIPVAYSYYEITIPEYFKFSKKMHGYEHIQYKPSSRNITFYVNAQRLSCLGHVVAFEGVDIPALKGDDYVWNKGDYMSKVSFDLSGIQWPESPFKSLASTWADIDDRLKDNDSFGSQMKYSNLLKEDLIPIVKSDMDTIQKMEAVLALVKSKVKWNKKNTLYSDNVKKALKEGLGSSAEMNALLINVLRDAGFDANPVVMSLRSNGRLFVPNPSIKNLNYFIVGVDAGGKTYYMDAAEKHGYVNVIHSECMVDEARYMKKTPVWVDLHNLVRSSTMSTIDFSFNEDGILAGTAKIKNKGISQINLSRKADAETEDDSMQHQKASELGVEIQNYEFKKLEDGSTSVQEDFAFENKYIRLGEEFLYINPICFPIMTQNPFKAEVRKLPIEFPYVHDYAMISTLKLPANYVVEELPKMERIAFDEDKSIYFTYIIEQKENTIQTVARLTIKNLIYTVDQYEFLRDFFTRIANKNTAQLVLKKVPNSSPSAQPIVD